MTIYAAYGSNMDPAQMLQRCPHSPLAGTGWIKGAGLTLGGEELGWEGALATIVREEEGRAFVALYDVTAKDEPRLDAWEGADTGLYQKIRLLVHTLEADELAWVYVL